MDNIGELFKKSLNRRLAEVGWSQNDLARRTGVPQSNISRYCLGRSEPGISHAGAIATAFGLSLDGFMGGQKPVYAPDLSPDLLPVLLEIATLLPSMDQDQLETLLIAAKGLVRLDVTPKRTYKPKKAR